MYVPTVTGGPSSQPVVLMMPDMAWMSRSRPGQSARGPVWPYPDKEQYTRRGLSCMHPLGIEPQTGHHPRAKVVHQDVTALAPGGAQSPGLAG